MRPGPAIDIYGLGGILYFLLTHRPPFLGATLVETLFKVAHEEVVPPRQLAPAVPPELEGDLSEVLAERTRSALLPRPGSLPRPCKPGPPRLPRIPWRSRPGLRVSLPERIFRPVWRRPRPPLSLLPAGARALWPWVVGVVLMGSAVGAGVHFLRNWNAPIPVQTQPREGPSQSCPGTTGADHPYDRFHPVGENRDGTSVSRSNSSEVKRGADGERAMVEGKEGPFQAPTGGATLTFGIWGIDADGTVTQIFPNEFEPDSFLKADEARTIPGKASPGKESYTFETTVSKGLDHFWVVASTVPWNAIEGQHAGPYTIFKSEEEQERWGRQVRGILIKPQSGMRSVTGPKAVAEEVFSLPGASSVDPVSQALSGQREGQWQWADGKCRVCATGLGAAVLLALLWGSSVLRAQSSSPNAQELLQEANLKVAAGKLLEAERLYRRALEVADDLVSQPCLEAPDLAQRPSRPARPGHPVRLALPAHPAAERACPSPHRSPAARRKLPGAGSLSPGGTLPGRGAGQLRPATPGRNRVRRARWPGLPRSRRNAATIRRPAAFWHRVEEQVLAYLEGGMGVVPNQPPRPPGDPDLKQKIQCVWRLAEALRFRKQPDRAITHLKALLPMHAQLKDPRRRAHHAAPPGRPS